MSGITYGFTDRYKLEPYRGAKSRSTCPSCGKAHQFTRFVDVTNGQYVGDDTVGRCNREVNCGYFKPPTTENLQGEIMVPNHKVIKAFREPEIQHYIDFKTVLSTLDSFDNNLVRFLLKVFPAERVLDVINRYKVGTVEYWYNQATVFWQIDQNLQVRTGKVMLYDETNGKRIKEPKDRVSWAHSPYNLKDVMPDFYLQQCFFGEHLLRNNPDKVVHIVESEKTAIISTIVKPNTLWVATGGLQNIGEQRLSPFAERKMIFYPDKGKAYQVWKSKLEPFMGVYDIEISDFLERIDMTEETDMADYILTKHIKNDI